MERRDPEEFSYTVLVYEDRFGVWVKLPELDIQCLTEDWEVGLEVLEEQLEFQLRRKGEYVPRRLVRTVRHVDKDEYGLTQVEIEERRYLEELAEEYGDEDKAD